MQFKTLQRAAAAAFPRGPEITRLQITSAQRRRAANHGWGMAMMGAARAGGCSDPIPIPTAMRGQEEGKGWGQASHFKDPRAPPKPWGDAMGHQLGNVLDRALGAHEN